MISPAVTPDVIVLDDEMLVHTRLQRVKKNPQILQAKSYRLPTGVFSPSPVTPMLQNEAGLAEVLRRLTLDAGKLDKVCLLLPDSWFRINILDLPSIPEKAAEARDVLRWALARALPIRPEELRISYQELPPGETGRRVLVCSAVENTLAQIEAVFAAARIQVVVIETIGLNIWNAVAAQEAGTDKDRLFIYLREKDFTTAVFRGNTPLFIRSRNLSGERTVAQELRLSASYLKSNLQSETMERCYIAGNRIDQSIADVVQQEFAAPAKPVTLRDYADPVVSTDTSSFGAEVTACMGVFAA